MEADTKLDYKKLKIKIMTSQKLIRAIDNESKDSINFIDIGCHKGAFLQSLSSKINKRINHSMGIDPIDHGVRGMYNTFLNVAVDNVKDKTTKTLHLYPETGCNSLLELNKEILTQNPTEYDNKWYVGGRNINHHYTKQKEILVNVNSMSNILTELNYHESIDVVKIDTQGNDLDVLLSFGDYISSIKYIQIETVYTHNKEITLYKGQSIFEEDNKIIKSLGFEIIDIMDWGQNRDQCPEADIVYYNTKFNTKLI